MFFGTLTINVKDVSRIRIWGPDEINSENNEHNRLTFSSTCRRARQAFLVAKGRGRARRQVMNNVMHDIVSS